MCWAWAGPALAPAIQADLGHPQESGAAGVSLDSPRIELGSCQPLGIISE